MTVYSFDELCASVIDVAHLRHRSSVVYKVLAAGDACVGNKPECRLQANNPAVTSRLTMY